MSRSTPISKKTSGFRKNLAGLLILLAFIALLSTVRKPKVAITVSGTTLTMSRKSIIEQQGKPSYKMGWPEPELIEYWAAGDSPHRDLSYRFDTRGLVYQIKGGTPQLNGIDVGSWTLDQIEEKLGPSDREGRLSQEAPFTPLHHKSKIKFLAYPEHHLLVRHSLEHGIDFILFTGPASATPE